MRHSARLIVREVGKRWPWFNRMVYRPFKGAHRGYWYHLPWNRHSYVSCAML
jgi:hypothetical protein